MKLIVNGKPREIADVSNVAAMVEQLGLRSDRVAVELNLNIVPRAEWEATTVREGDRVEVVQFVGGGSGFTF